MTTRIQQTFSDSSNQHVAFQHHNIGIHAPTMYSTGWAKISLKISSFPYHNPKEKAWKIPGSHWSRQAPFLWLHLGMVYYWRWMMADIFPILRDTETINQRSIVFRTCPKCNRSVLTQSECLSSERRCHLKNYVRNIYIWLFQNDILPCLGSMPTSHVYCRPFQSLRKILVASSSRKVDFIISENPLRNHGFWGVLNMGSFQITPLQFLQGPSIFSSAAVGGLNWFNQFDWWNMVKYLRWYPFW